MKKYTVTLGSALLVLAGFFALTASVHAAPFSDSRFACQVLTVSGQQGLVMVRMDTEEEALAAAARSQSAQTAEDTWESVQTVVECVDYPDGKFADPQFLGFMERLPR